MATTAPVVECADRAAARARQAATTPEICIAFPTMIERRPKILRLGDKSDPFMFAVNLVVKSAFRRPTHYPSYKRHAGEFSDLSANGAAPCAAEKISIDARGIMEFRVR